MTNRDDETQAIIDQETSMLLGDPDLVTDSVSLTPAELADLDAVARDLGVTREALLRRAVTDFLAGRNMDGTG